MKKILYGGIFAITGLLVILVIRVIISDTSEGTNFVYHVLLADPEIYDDGVYSETFQISTGSYRFKFIPNGDSPQQLMIKLDGKSFSFSEDYELKGTLHKSPISEYFTWDYTGQKEFQVDQGQTLNILIDPNGDVIGTVSILIGR